MTNFFDSEFDRIFKKMSSSFFDIDDVFEEFKGNGSESGPYYYASIILVLRLAPALLPHPLKEISCSETSSLALLSSP
jgi:hypothetical protein